jgi:hypothetical protein
MKMNDQAAKLEAEANTLRRTGRRWLDRIKASEKREDTWLRHAAAAVKSYLGDEDDDAEGRVYDFNILFSNIETMLPAVINSTPFPDVRERFRTGRNTPETAVAQVVAQVIERAILTQIDDAALYDEIEAGAHDALLAGRGIVRVRFDADEAEIPGAPVIDPETGMPAMDEGGQIVMSPPQIVMQNERLGFEVVSWRDFRMGPAKRWSDVPWVAFRHCLSWDQAQKIQDVRLRNLLRVGADDSAVPDRDGDDDTHIWEIWDKDNSKVLMVHAENGDVVQMHDDPLGLKGFFPCHRPIQPIFVAGSMKPVVPFNVYRKLAEELETITKRIRRITEGLKVRGLIIGSAEDIQQLSDAGDNELVPIANIEGLGMTGALDGAISWWPVEKSIVVLRELYVLRDKTKDMIYEVTGISDIVRGQGHAGETATAQQIKSQWGSLRIQRLRTQINNAVRQLFVICAELISSKFSPETLSKMTSIAMDQLAAEMLQAPLDHYRVDVESDSTVRADLSRRKGEMSEFLNATASFFQVMMPLTQASPQLMPMIGEMYGAFARQYSLGKQAEDAIEEMAELAKQAAQMAEQQKQQTQQQQAEAAQKAEMVNAQAMNLEERKVAAIEAREQVRALDTLAKVG